MDLEKYFDRLWPICRSIMGEGTRESLRILDEVMPMDRLTYPTGTKVFDWTVPNEWSVADAYIIDPKGVKRAEFKKNNLHLLNYSSPFRGKISLEELKKHIFTDPDMPEAIPYRTSYYKEQWGFCLAHKELQALPSGDYEVVVDTALKPGQLEIGEAILPGDSKEEIIFSSYVCHPSLANNELSGPLVLTKLYDKLKAMPKRRYTYRFVLSAETLGTIAYLSTRGEHLRKSVVAGYVITCVGDSGPFTYKFSRRSDTLADRAAQSVAKEAKTPWRWERFDPSDGSDERQYCSPGFDFPMGSLMRTMYGKFREYHTSLDNKDFVAFAAMDGSVEEYLKIVSVLEGNEVLKNASPFGEPQLGRRGLYSMVGEVKVSNFVGTVLWLLNLADGTNDLISIAEKSGKPISEVIETAKILKEKGLLVPVS
jgi:aminopeptidase-like protein